MISYTRARAEGLGVRCDVGMMQRAERVILIGFAALIFGEATLLGVQGLALRVVIIGLAILTNITVDTTNRLGIPAFAPPRATRAGGGGTPAGRRVPLRRTTRRLTGLAHFTR